MQRDEAASRRIAKNMIFAELFVKEISYASIITTSYPMLHELGSSGSFSGILIGAPKLTGVVGALISDWFSGWSLRSQILLAPLLRTLSTAVFVIVSIFPDAWTSANGAIWLLVGARLIEGLGSGIAAIAMRNVLVITSETEEEQDLAQADRVYYESIGMGFGPLVGSLLMYLALEYSGWQIYAAPSIMAFAFSLTLSIVALVVFPVEISPARRLSVSFSGGNADGQESRSFFAATLSCIFLIFLLQYCTSNLESAMAFIFETEYRWSAQDAGTIVSCTFLSCIPFRWLWQALTSTELSRIAFTGR